MKLFNTGHLPYFYCHGYAATLPGLLMAELTSLNLGEGGSNRYPCRCVDRFGSWRGDRSAPRSADRQKIYLARKG